MKKLTIYIASSWKNQHAVEMITTMLEERGHEVISFVREAVRVEGRENLRFDIDEWIASEDGRKNFEFNTNGAITSDLVIYIGPAGTDAWAEVGAAWASGREVIGLWAKGEPAGLTRRMVTWYFGFQSILSHVDFCAKER